MSLSTYAEPLILLWVIGWLAAATWLVYSCRLQPRTDLLRRQLAEHPKGERITERNEGAESRRHPDARTRRQSNEQRRQSSRAGVRIHQTEERPQATQKEGHSEDKHWVKPPSPGSPDVLSALGHDDQSEDRKYLGVQAALFSRECHPPSVGAQEPGRPQNGGDPP